MDEKAKQRIAELNELIADLMWKKKNAEHRRDFEKREYLNYMGAKDDSDFQHMKWNPQDVKKWEDAAKKADAEFEVISASIDRKIEAAKDEIANLEGFGLIE